MPNSFDGYSRNPFVGYSANPFAGYPTGRNEGGIFGTLIRLPVTILEETVLDVIGGVRTLGAAAMTPLDALGFAVPITWDELTDRDKKGALMLAAMGAGGVAANALRGTPAFLKIAGSTADDMARGVVSLRPRGIAGRMAATSLAEGVAGAAFGMVQPLEEGQERGGAILTGAAVGAGFGAGASLARSAYRATLGQYRAGLAKVKQQAYFAETLQNVEQERQVSEILGISLANPDTKQYAALRARGGKTYITYFDETGKKIEGGREAMSYGSAVSDLIERGYTDRMGFALMGKRLPAKQLEKVGELGVQTLDLLQQGDAGLEALQQRFRVGEYEAVRRAAAQAAERGQELAWLEAEAVTDRVAAYGTLELDIGTKDAIIHLAKIPANRAVKLSDSEILREGIRAGYVDLDNLRAGLDVRDFMRQLTYSDMVPSGMAISTTPVRDAFMTRLATPQMLARMNPEFLPMFNLAESMGVSERNWKAKSASILSNLPAAPAASQKLAVNTIEGVLGEAEAITFRGKPIEVARQLARERLAALPDQAAGQWGTQVLELLDLNAMRAVAQGRLAAAPFAPPVVARARAALKQAVTEGYEAPQVQAAHRKTADEIREQARSLLRATGDSDGLQALDAMVEDAGLAAYFPIVNHGEFHVHLNGKLFPQTFSSYEEARAALVELGRQGQDIGTATIRPKRIVWDQNALTLMESKQFKKMIDSIQAADPSLSRKEAQAIAGAEGVIPAAAAVGLKYHPQLQRRRVGMREFSEDPTTSLTAYLFNTDRALAWHDFRRQATAITEQVLPEKENLRRMMELYTKDMLGDPRPSESLFDNAVQVLGLTDKPRAMSRWSAALRRFESASRLGGAWSGVVNASQLFINGYPVLGAKYTSVGIRTLLDPKEARRIQQVFHKYGHDLGAHANMTSEGLDAVPGSIKELAKGGKYLDVVERAWMSAFAGAEKWNRVGVAAGALKRELDRNGGQLTKAAVDAAFDVVKRTQFDYGKHNVPELLRGPFGAVMGQFKSFFIREMEFMAGLNRKEMLRFGVAMQAIGGVALFTNLPGADLVSFAQGAFFDRTTEEWLKTAPGEGPAGRFAVFGMPGLIGVDFSDYAGIGTVGDAVRNVFGPAPSDIGRLFEFVGSAMGDIGAYGSVTGETKTRFVQNTLPSQFRRIMRGYNIVASGGEVRNPYTSKLIYRPEDRARAAWTQALGAPLIEMQQQRAYDQITTRVMERYRKARSNYGRDAAMAYIQGDPAKGRAVLEEARRAGINIDQRSLKTYVRNLQLPANERRKKRLAKDLREYYRELWETTGTIDPEDM